MKYVVSILSILMFAGSVSANSFSSDPGDICKRNAQDAAVSYMRNVMEDYPVRAEVKTEELYKSYIVRIQRDDAPAGDREVFRVTTKPAANNVNNCVVDKVDHLGYQRASY